jgi:hypothetical protein
MFYIFKLICNPFAIPVLDGEEEGNEVENQEYNLLVSSATEPTVVYR